MSRGWEPEDTLAQRDARDNNGLRARPGRQNLVKPRGAAAENPHEPSPGAAAAGRARAGPDARGAHVETKNLVVARFLDGRVMKGVTHDFTALRPSLHIHVEGTPEGVEVRVRQLKALFFVKSFEGSPARDDVRGFIDGPQENARGRKIAVRFRDGEFMCGYTMSWTPEREGFFIFPADEGGNNDRVYVVSAATAEVKAGPAAEVLAQRVLSGTAGAAPSNPGIRVRPNLPGTRPPASDAA